MDIVLRPISEIKPYNNNPREISQSAVDAIAQSITKYGFRQPVVITRDGTIIAGHGRYLASLKIGLTQIPVHVADLTDTQANAYRIDDNRIGELSRWVLPKLVDEIDLLPEGELISFNEDEINELIGNILDAEETGGQLSPLHADEKDMFAETDEADYQYVTLKIQVPKEYAREARMAIEQVVSEITGSL